MKEKAAMLRPELPLPEGGDDEAWRLFFEAYDGRIRSVVAWSRWRFSVPVQEDIAQHIRMEVVKAAGTFKGQASVGYFIKRIAMHRCVDEVRRQVRKKWLLNEASLGSDDDEGVGFIDGSADLGPGLMDEVLQLERQEQVKVLLAELDPTCQEAVDLFYLKEQSYREISEGLGLAVSTVGSRLYKCLAKLREIVGESRLFGEYFGKS